MTSDFKHFDWCENYLSEKIETPDSLIGLEKKKKEKTRDSVPTNVFHPALKKAAKKLCDMMKLVTTRMDEGETDIRYSTDGLHEQKYTGSTGVVLRDIVKKDIDRLAMWQYGQMMSPELTNKLRAPVFSVDYTLNPTRTQNQTVKEGVSIKKW